MKRIVLAAALLMAAATAAHANHDVWTDMLKHRRSDDVVNADAAQCREQPDSRTSMGRRCCRPTCAACAPAGGASTTRP
jgi:hypothetical protein